MRTARRCGEDWVLVTGATGFVGAALVYELLSRGHRVLCLVRAATPASARERMMEALRGWTSDAERLLETGRLAVPRGDVHISDAGLSEALCRSLRGRIKSLVHAAGHTRFASTSDGEPALTNVDGTRNILRLAKKLECRDWHLISTAYVAGVAEEAWETVGVVPPEYRNAYERSKWESEHLAGRHARESGATLTVYRPSIVVGHSETGRATRFTGIYYLFRATSLLARLASQQTGLNRHAIDLQIPAVPEGRPNLICSDDVAGAFGDLFENRAARGGVYHLTHPTPPTNAQIKRVLEDYYDIAGGRFGGNAGEARAQQERNANQFQTLFDEMTATVADYLFDAPRFDRARVKHLVRRSPAPWTDARLRRLIDVAETGGWRSGGFERQLAGNAGDVGAYFTEHLPRHLGRSSAARVEQLDVTVRFEIGRRAAGSWWCRFQGGQVADVGPGGGRSADVIYRTSESRFWAAVAGEISGAELFLSGEAQIDGDIERALKFAIILEEFVREHPYRRTDTLASSGEGQ
jgi:nucleoside-diphosphate-sugar epimerase